MRIENYGQRLRLATTAVGWRLASAALLRQRRCLPSALRGLNALNALKGFKDLSWPYPKQTPPLLRSSPSNSEGDVHGAVHTISTTPPDLLLGEAAERNFDHPSHPPLS